MTSYFQQALYVSDPWGNPSEVVNGSRTMARLASLGSCGAGRYANVLDDAGCEALSWGPCASTEPLVAAPDGYSWAALSYGATDAPWHDNSADSLNAYGFTILDWTGLDYAHAQRIPSPLGGRPGGSRFALPVSKHRVMKLNVVLHAANDRALDFLFHWLTDVLSGCGGCDEMMLWTRTIDPYLSTSPTFTELERGWVKMRNVALIEGPTWEDQPTPNSGSVMRMASFTLAAGDPALYEWVDLGADGDVTTMATTSHSASAAATVAACNSFLNSASGAARAVVLPARGFGTVSPHIFISSAGATRAGGTRKSLPDLRITGYLDPTASYTAGRVTDPDRCGLLKVGELILSGNGTSGLDIQVDLGARKVLYREPGSLDGWSDGTWMVAAPQVGQKRWWGIPRCPGQGLLVVEPAYSSLINSADYVLYGTSDAITSWTVAFRAFHRYGAP